jgi:hypothetical protein
MKRALVVVVAMVLAAGTVMRAQASKPYPELKQLEPFIGDWTSTGEDKATPLGPAGKTSGKALGKWILHGFVLEWEYSYTDAAGRKVTGREFDGYDPLAKTFQARWFENDGSYTTGTYTPNGNVIVFLGTSTNATKKWELRQTYTFAPDFKSYTYKAEISMDGGKLWILANEGKGTKAAAAK